ncbi:MAG TPA: lipid-A-disaccharide synthase [Rhodocyclaceae bacterium]|jgi:lipid-A-disaccharide synthase|nr:lipid-A-disaccharide synthase [Rhodocyclaceae bacterium]HMV19726.1 lipid-A-disaccharide synthase [Rhodocyclaceae bacterium]HMW76290.1 lipid-A-disaccharide synthase [Rhodocyclaceae bacterium]HNE42289.1 lipid-A-disaccharide synthase [Rhodocyclaceae bacterium]HNL20640.1 lipid-A-disaccharide synthase [Rhodocyclaceae bacterium]
MKEVGREVRIALVAGEASGDLLASHLLAALRERLPRAKFFGIGGPRMESQGFDAWWPAEKLAVRGYFEVLRHYREIAGIRRQLKKRLLADPPDVFIGVDAPDFNLDLEAALKRRGIRTIHYISPSIWAWRGGRIKSMHRAVDKVLALFPMEPPLYQKAGIPVAYVGHPMADTIPLTTDKAEVRVRLELPAAAPIFALLPGSRQSELQYMAATFVATAKLLHERHYPNSRFLVPLATRETRLLFEQAIYEGQAADVPFRLLFGHAQDALGAADVALVASGTATLEAALVKRPMVITYKVAPASAWIMRRMGYLPYVGLPNILAGRFVVPEILQEEATPDNLAAALVRLYEDKAGAEALAAVFTDIHLQLRQGTAARAAEAVLQCLS